MDAMEVALEGEFPYDLFRDVMGFWCHCTTEFLEYVCGFVIGYGLFFILFLFVV
jgi:hypothetical protein